MKEFKEYIKEKKENLSVNEGLTISFEQFIAERSTPTENGLEFLTESENAEIDKWVRVFEEECQGKLENIDEGFLGRIFGGVAGFLVGPLIGKIIARALGIEKGVLYDMFTSRLVSTALGASIAKNMDENGYKIEKK